MMLYIRFPEFVQRKFDICTYYYYVHAVSAHKRFYVCAMCAQEIFAVMSMCSALLAVKLCVVTAQKAPPADYQLASRYICGDV